MAKCLNKGVVIWITGLPGSGKTTIALGVAERLRKQGYRVEVIDGDWARKTISLGAGYTKEERRIHLHRIAWVARLLARNGVIVLCSFVSPYLDVREMVRKIVEEEAPFMEVYVKCSIEEAIRRDPKGLYSKALKGEIKHMTGIDDPYEPPKNPDVIVDTEHKSIEENIKTVLRVFEKKFTSILEIG